MRIRNLCAVLAILAVLALPGCQVQPTRNGVADPTPSVPAVPEPDYWPTTGWKASTPEQQGMDSARLAAMLEAVDGQQLNLHSILVIRNGYTVLEAYYSPYSATVKQQVASLTESVTGMLTGIAIGQGQIKSTSQPVLGFFPRRSVANLDQNKRSLTLEHLLTMTTGLDCSDAAGTRDQMFQSPDWVQFTLDLPMASAPGARFSDCSPAAHVLAAVVSEATGKNVRDLANDALFAPLGIPRASADDWDSDPQGIADGCCGLSLTPADMARLGFLYLHGGNWNGQQVVPASWVSASLAPHAADSTGRKYGYLFWLYDYQGYYSAQGLGGQDIHIIPAKNMVVVFTAAVDSPTHDKALLKLLDDYIIPAAKDAQTLPDNPSALAQLQQRIRHAASPTVPPPLLPAMARQISGNVYQMTANPFGWTTIALTFTEGSAEAVATINGSSKLLIGLDNVFRTSWNGSAVEAARGHWEGPDSFVVDDETLGGYMQYQYRMTFSGSQVQIGIKDQLSGGSIDVYGRQAP